MGAWKLYSRPVVGWLGESEGKVGKLDGWGNEDDGGGNSSNIRGSGKRWALAGVRGMMTPLPNQSKGTQAEVAVANAIGRLNGLENRIIVALSGISYESIRGLTFRGIFLLTHKVTFGSRVSSLSPLSFSSVIITASTNSRNA